MAGKQDAPDKGRDLTANQRESTRMEKKPQGNKNWQGNGGRGMFNRKERRERKPGRAGSCGGRIMANRNLYTKATKETKIFVLHR
jgi:hypothetical protein